VGTYTYDVFGAIRSETGGQANDYRFTGQQLEAAGVVLGLRCDLACHAHPSTTSSGLPGVTFRLATRMDSMPAAAGRRKPVNPPRFHPGFTPIFEPKGSAIRPGVEGGPSSFQAGCRGFDPRLPPQAPLDVTTRASRGPPEGGLLLCRQVVRPRLVAQRKDPGLLIRESWVRIPPGPPGDIIGLHRRVDHRVTAIGPSLSRWVGWSLAVSACARLRLVQEP
jgi:hypothetical protein